MLKTPSLYSWNLDVLNRRSEKGMQRGSRNPVNHTMYMVNSHPNNGLQDLGIIFLSTLVAIKISAIKSRRTKLFPFGQFVYEALYSLLKGLMIIGMLLAALTDNLAKIFHFINGGTFHVLTTEVIMVYSISMTVLCFGMAIFYQQKNNKLNNASTLLRAEYSAALIDGFMSLATGVRLVGVSYQDPQGSLGFLHYIGDSIIVILLCLLLGKDPIMLIRDSFIELAGGTLQNQAEKKTIEDILINHLPYNKLYVDSYISKTGSGYLVVAYLSSQELEKLGFETIEQIKTRICKNLKKHHREIIFEIVLE